MKKPLMLGLVLIAIITAFGGGTVRDLMLGNKQFFWMTHQELVLAIIVIGVVTPFFFRARHIEITGFWVVASYGPSSVKF